MKNCAFYALFVLLMIWLELLIYYTKWINILITKMATVQKKGDDGF